MARRLELQALLVSTLGSNNVYFQPPPTINMIYPCIVYRRNLARTEFAGNKPYKNMYQYQIIFMDRDPDSDIPDKIGSLVMCRYDRFYTANNLNHDVFNIFF